MSRKLNYMFHTTIIRISLLDSPCALSGGGYEKQMAGKYMNKTLAFGKHIDTVGMSYVNMQNKYHSRVYT